jgi:hypothetical protein
MTERSLKAVLEAQYPLPDWTVDSKFKQDLTRAVAEAIGAATEQWPDLQGPGAQLDYAEHVTKTVLEAMKPLLHWLKDYTTDGFSYPGDPLVAYISQLALTRPDEAPQTDRYRQLLRYYGRYLARQAEHFG